MASTSQSPTMASAPTGRFVREDAPLASDAISYEDLYARWERGNWRATELDFTEDARQWREEFTDFERMAALWNYALFFWGEDAVADNLSPYIDAAPLEEQKYFLTTQQVDEARHAVFFKRFMREVCGIGDGSVGGGLQAIRPQLTVGFRKIFGRLDTMADELRADRSRPKLAAAVTLYHLVVEATLAQTGQHMIVDYLEQRDLLPAFREGMNNIALDEQRHIGFGVKLLADLRREDPRVPGAVAELLREVLPYGPQVLMPPNWDERYLTCFGWTFDKIGAEGANSLATKLRAAGLAFETLPGPPVIPVGLTPEELSIRGRKLAMAGITGVREGPSARDEESVELLFDMMARSAMRDAVRRPTVLAWEFTDPDIGDWHLVVENGSTRAERGRPTKADLRLKVAYQDWVNVIGDRVDPRRLMLSGRLRPRGNPLGLLKLQKVFPR